MSRRAYLAASSVLWAAGSAKTHASDMGKPNPKRLVSKIKNFVKNIYFI